MGFFDHLVAALLQAHNQGAPLHVDQVNTPAVAVHSSGTTMPIVQDWTGSLHDAAIVQHHGHGPQIPGEVLQGGGFMYPAPMATGDLAQHPNLILQHQYPTTYPTIDLNQANNSLPPLLRSLFRIQTTPSYYSKKNANPIYTL